MNHAKQFISKIRHYPENKNSACLLMIFLGFLLTSCGYLSWLYLLISLLPASSDFISMEIGYTLQAAGIGLAAWFLRARKDFFRRKPFMFTTALYMLLLLLLAAFSSSPVPVVILGLLLNLVCGVIAAFYLHALALLADESCLGRIFGLGYAGATVVGWLISLPGEGSFLASKKVLVLYLILTVLLMAAALPVFAPRTEEEGPESTPALPKKYAGFSAFEKGGKNLILAFFWVFLISLVKNTGFTFPSADLAGGVSLELTRILYAAGLVLAGYVNDRDRRTGAVCTIAALITPFIILALSGEEVMSMVFWCLDYLVFGFFSVHRVVLFSDISRNTDLIWLSGFGLLAGRLGDAAGTGIGRIFSGTPVILVTVSALLFCLTVFVFSRLYQLLYTPAEIRPKTEKELFELFSVRHDLSSRERDVLRLILAGCSNTEMAEMLFVSESTVKFHIHNILKKTGCKNRTQLKSDYALKQS